MNARLLASHLGVALLAFGLGYLVFSALPRGRRGSAIDRRIPSPPSPRSSRSRSPMPRTRALLDFFAVADPAWAERLRDEVDNRNPDRAGRDRRDPLRVLVGPVGSRGRLRAGSSTRAGRTAIPGSERSCGPGSWRIRRARPRPPPRLPPNPDRGQLEARARSSSTGGTRRLRRSRPPARPDPQPPGRVAGRLHPASDRDFDRTSRDRRDRAIRRVASRRRRPSASASSRRCSPASDRP